MFAMPIQPVELPSNPIDGDTLEAMTVMSYNRFLLVGPTNVRPEIELKLKQDPKS